MGFILPIIFIFHQWEQHILKKRPAIKIGNNIIDCYLPEISLVPGVLLYKSCGFRQVSANVVLRRNAKSFFPLIVVILKYLRWRFWVL